MPHSEHIREQIRRLRKARGWTIRDLAERVGTSEATVSRLETRHIAMSMEWVGRFAEAFEVDLADLLGGAGVPFTTLGAVDEDRRLNPSAAARLTVPSMGEDAIAVELSAEIGPFVKGDILLGVKITPDVFEDYQGRFVFAAKQKAENTVLVFGRALTVGEEGGIRLISPIGGGAEATAPEECAWIAAVQMRITAYDRAVLQSGDGARETAGQAAPKDNS